MPNPMPVLLEKIEVGGRDIRVGVGSEFALHEAFPSFASDYNGRVSLGPCNEDMSVSLWNTSVWLYSSHRMRL